MASAPSLRNMTYSIEAICDHHAVRTLGSKFRFYYRRPSWTPTPLFFCGSSCLPYPWPFQVGDRWKMGPLRLWVSPSKLYLLSSVRMILRACFAEVLYEGLQSSWVSSPLNQYTIECTGPLRNEMAERSPLGNYIDRRCILVSLSHSRLQASQPMSTPILDSE